MKNNENTDQLQRFLKEGMHTIPSADFNERVISTYLSEREASTLKPDINYSYLLISAAIMSLLVGLILHLKAAASTFYPIITDSESTIEMLYIGLFAVTSFTIFTLISDIIEERKSQTVPIH